MKAWIFDLDGTLTVPMHDFAALKRDLGLPAELDVLEGIARRTPAEQERLLASVKRWEEDLADQAVASPDALALLEALEGRPLGVLTRNTRSNALRTMKAAGLSRFFDPVDVLGRNCAPPKPDPAGILHITGRWDIDPAEVTMVGDWFTDVDAGIAAGCRTIWVDRDGDGRFDGRADVSVKALSTALAS